jgi:hypothetical protein
MYIYIYIYIYRERERESARSHDILKGGGFEVYFDIARAQASFEGGVLYICVYVN